MPLPLGRTQEASPKITAQFKKLAREKSFTDEMIKMLPRQGEHGPALSGWLGQYGEPGRAGRDQLGPSLPPLCGLRWQEKALRFGTLWLSPCSSSFLGCLFWVLNAASQTKPRAQPFSLFPQRNAASMTCR